MAALDPMQELPLMGREVEVRALGRALRGLSKHRGGVVVVTGDVGTGKSRLLQEATRSARRRRVGTLRAIGSPAARRAPFEAAIQLAGGLSTRPVIAPLLADAALGGNGDGLAAHAAFTRDLYWALVTESRERPVLVTVDRLEHLDAETARLLQYLAARIDDHGILLICAVRDAAGDDAGLVHELMGASRSLALHLGPLPSEALDSLREDGLDSRYVDALHAESAGYPDLLAELATEAHRRGVAGNLRGLAELAAAGIPGVNRLVAAALHDAGSDGGQVARAAVVLGADATPDAVAAAAGVPTDELPGIVETLADLGVLARDQASRRPLLAPRAPAIAAALAATTPEPVRARLGRAAAQALAAAGQDSRAAATYLLQVPAGRSEDAALMLLSAARDLLSSGDLERAVSFLARGLAETPSEDLERDLRTDLAAAECALGRPNGEADHGRRVAQLPDDRQRADALHRLADAQLATGNRRGAAATLERGIVSVAGEARTELEARYVTVALDIPELSAHARSYMAHLSRANGLTPSLAARLAIERVVTSNATESAAELARWAADRGLLDDPGAGAADAKPFVIGVLAWCDQLAEAQTQAQRILEAAPPGSPVEGAAHAFLAVAQLASGEIRPAAGSARVAVDAATLGRAGSAGIVAAAVLVRALIELGDREGAAQALEGMRAITTRGGGEHYLSDVEGWLLLARHEPEAALARFRAAAVIAEESGLTNPSLLAAEFGEVTALVRLRRSQEARTAAAEALERAKAFGAPRPVAAALRVGARAHGHERGLEMVEEGLAVLGGSEAALERTRCLVARGAILRRLNRRNEARDTLRDALDAAHRMEAAGLAARAYAELLAAGARPRRPYLAGRESLTPAERRVAEMAATGATNREIAQALFVTTKTVEWHLHNVFAKLHVSSRAEMASEFADERVA